MNYLAKDYQRRQLFERVCMLCSDELQQFIFTLTRQDRFATEEIYQNTMLGALRGLDYLRDSRRMKAWIFAIARAEARRYYANLFVKNCFGSVPKGGADNGIVLDFTKSVEDRELTALLIGLLTKRERQLCIMHYFDGLSLREISELLNLNYNTTRSIHLRGIAKLRESFRKYA